MNIQTNDEKNTIPVTEDDAFSYDGYRQASKASASMALS